MPLAAGTKLNNYEIVGLLGAGGMGEVYRARDPVLRREVAIKVLPPFVVQDPDRLRRFEQEAQAAAALNHPNILAVFQFGSFEGAPYLVSELLEGETLRELLRGPMPVRKTVDYGVQIARGLAAAHEKGIVHRDLKPENLFVTKDGRVKILDFGLAKLTEPKPRPEPGSSGPTITLGTRPGVVMGTAGYMSPEQVRGQPADHRADIFAFGAVLYEMLAGKRAFQRSTSAETMTAILNARYFEDRAFGPAGIAPRRPSVPGEEPGAAILVRLRPGVALDALSESGSTAAATAVQAASHRKWIWSLAAAVAAAIAVSLIVWWRLPPAVPVVLSVTQLTDDGQPKIGDDGNGSTLVTDGSRVYFNEGDTGNIKIGQVSVTGGATAAFPTTLANPYIAGLAPDGSSLLALSGNAGITASKSVWTISLPAGELRRLGGTEAEFAGFLPTGGLLFARDNDIYSAESDGSDVRKLFSLPAGHIAGMPEASPDGKRIVYTDVEWPKSKLVEIDFGGTQSHALVEPKKGDADCCGRWTADGKYLLYEGGPITSAFTDIWAVSMQSGLFHRSAAPVRLTNGPLSYSNVISSRDGKQIFAVGTLPRGELVRYDRTTGQFVPFLSGISARSPTFSADGQWVAYISYPENTLWRSRADGSERSQLTYPPMDVAEAGISPDGKLVAFQRVAGDSYVVGLDGSPPRRIVQAGSWSPDGSMMVINPLIEGKSFNDKNNSDLETLDIQTGKRTVVPGSQGFIGAVWAAPDTLVATREDQSEARTYSFKTGTWTDLLPGAEVYWYCPSSDGRYLYYITRGDDPAIMRLQMAGHKTEKIGMLNGLHRVPDPWGNRPLTLAPDGSPLFTRDIGTEEIYALNVKWP